MASGAGLMLAPVPMPAQGAVVPSVQLAGSGLPSGANVLGFDPGTPQLATRNATLTFASVDMLFAGLATNTFVWPRKLVSPSGRPTQVGRLASGIRLILLIMVLALLGS